MPASERFSLNCPDHLASAITLGAVPTVGPLTRRSRWTLMGLALLCLLLRVLGAAGIESVCDDGYYYMAVADALLQHDFQHAFLQLNVNVYPAILALLHSFGLDWVTAGKVWGVVISTATLLPLFGLLRQLFEERVAFAGGLLYAVHPALISIGVEPLREATFWFFFMSCLYTGWRAISETRWTWTTLAGALMAGAILTRTEGWFLLLPLAMWSAFRFGKRMLCVEPDSEMPAPRSPKPPKFPGIVSHKSPWRSAAVAGSVFVLPLALLMVVLLAAPVDGRWELVRSRHLRIFLTWLQGAGMADAGASSGRTWTYFEQYQSGLIETLHPVGAVLLLIGVIRWPKLVLHRDKSPLLPLCLLVLGAVWIYLSQQGGMNSRYFATVTLVSFGSSGLGLLYVVELIRRLLARWNVSVSTRTAFLTVAAGLVGGCCLDLINSDHESRREDVVLARWLRDRHGPFREAVVDRYSARVGYSVLGRLPINRFRDEAWEVVIQEHRPEVVIISSERYNAALQREMEDRLRRHGLRPASLPEALSAAGRFRAFVSAPQISQRRGAKTFRGVSGTAKR